MPKHPSHKPQPLRCRNDYTWLFFLIYFASLTMASAQSVALYLRGGDRITGTIISEDTNRVVLTTKWAKELVVPLGEILKREALAGPQVKPGEAKPTPAIGALTNAAPRPGTAGVSGPLQPVKPKSTTHLSGEAQVGVDLVFSQRKRQLYSGRFKATYAYEHFRNLFDYTFAYGKTDGLVSDNRMFGTAKTDFDLSKRLYLYNLGGAGYDEIRKIDLHYEFGPGVGCRLLKLTNLVLKTEVGANYQAEYRSDDTKSELFYYRLAENSAWAINGRFSVDEKFEFFPRVEDLAKYRFRFESNLRCGLLSNLAFVVTVVDQYH